MKSWQGGAPNIMCAGGEAGYTAPDPLNPASKPTKATANLFFGPGAGQGLDLAGNFVYAIAFGNERPGGQVGNVEDDPVPAPRILAPPIRHRTGS